MAYNDAFSVAAGTCSCSAIHKHLGTWAWLLVAERFAGGALGGQVGSDQGRRVGLPEGLAAVGAIDGGVHECRNLVEGVGNAAHNLVQVTLGEILDPYRVGRWRRLASYAHVLVMCGSWTLLVGPLAIGGIRVEWRYIFRVNNGDAQRHGAAGSQ